MSSFFYEIINSFVFFSPKNQEKHLLKIFLRLFIQSFGLIRKANRLMCIDFSQLKFLIRNIVCNTCIMKSFVSSFFFLAFSKAFTLHLICLSEVFKIFYEIWNIFSWGKEYVVLILNCMNGLIYMASITKSRIILNGRCYFFNDYKIVNGIKKVEIFIWKYNFFSKTELRFLVIFH